MRRLSGHSCPLLGVVSDSGRTRAPMATAAAGTGREQSAPVAPPEEGPAVAAAQDCFECKVTGTFTMCGLGAYVLYERAKMKPQDLRGRMIYAGISAALFATGAYRASM
jgi:hypothetical protein